MGTRNIEERKKNLQDLQGKIAKQRADLGKANRSLQEYIASRKKLEAALRKESGSSRNAAAMRLHANELKKVNATIDSLNKNIATIDASLLDLIGQVVVDTDPRNQVELMDDHVPFFLLPVRVETRFMTVKHIARVKRGSLTSTAGTLTVSGGTLAYNPTRYDVKDLFATYSQVPVVEDVNELWIRIFPDDIAIHTHEQPLTQQEVDAGQAFWTHMWYAGHDASLEIGAWRGLVGAYTPERAAWICNQTRPTNPAAAPAAPVDPSTPLPVAPQFPTPAIKASSWTQMPHSRVMPDRFVVRLYTGGNFREVVGNSIPDPLPVSLDPNDPASAIDNTNSKLILPDKLQWLQDFDEAESIGMAIRVPLSQAEKTAGFDKILVLGIKASADKAEAKTLLEELIDNHHYTPGGFSILKQGTPTNNTEDSLSGYTAQNADDEDLFGLELGAAQFTVIADDRKKRDGQRLAEALGIDYDKLYHIRNAGLEDVKEAMSMNEALWPTTLGYYLSQVMYPVFSNPDISRTKAHFNRYVLGRGRLPAIRVDDQPYGILPVTAFSRLQYTDNSFLNNFLHNLLQKMELTWNQLAQQVKHADQTFTSATTDKAFLDILGLHASSVEFYQRYATGPFFIWNVFAYNLVLQSQTVPASVSYASFHDFAALFQSLNYTLATPPRIFDFLYAVKEKYLNGPLIDPFPLSETRTLNAIGSQGENYIEWMYRSNYNIVAQERFNNIGSPGITPPNSLLYLMLRHSCLLEYVRTGINMLADRGLLSAEAWLDLEFLNIDIRRPVSLEMENLLRKKIEFVEGTKLNQQLMAQVDAEFERQAATGLLSGLNYQDIDKAKLDYYNRLKLTEEPAFTKTVESMLQSEITAFAYSGSKNRTMEDRYDFIGEARDLSDYIDTGIRRTAVDPELQEMAELRNALNVLKTLPTARLERLFCEHLDLASYRLDAWFSSLANERLEKLRFTGTTRQTGIFLGGYSWLENVRPGAFPGITYREVDIQPQGLTIPGVYEVAVTDIVYPKTIEAAPVKSFAPRKKGRVVPRDKKKFSMHFAKGDLLEAAPLVASGGIKLTLDDFRTEVMVSFPGLLDTPELESAGPAYIYLGTGQVGEITYDSITDKFISKPRVDPTNQGYIHAPSLNQASAAAVLRAGYEAHKLNAGSGDNAFAVNLTSDRVRIAMGYLEGIRNGQELAALLGYQFERGLHDLNQNLDKYIRDIRLKYPFAAARVTSTTGATNINEAEPYNVVDGLKLMEAYRDDPLHWSDGVVFSPVSDKNKIAQQIDKMMDSMDAVHDLLMAECVHQAVQGNSARSSAAFNAISGTSAPPEPQVINTPRQFNAITHRVGIVFDPSAGGATVWTAAGTPRSLAEPKLNRWLGAQLPGKNKIVVNCSYTTFDSLGNIGQTTDITMSAAEWKIEPIDLLYLLDISLEDDVESDLYSLISYYIRKDVAQADNINIRIKNADRTGLSIDEITLAELKPLTDALFKLVQDGKILDGKDFIPGTDADVQEAANPTAGLNTAGLLSRLQDAAGVTMVNGQKGLSGLVNELTQAINDLAPNVPSLPGTFNAAHYSRLRTAMLHSNYFGIPQSIPATATNYESEAALQLLDRAREALAKLTQRKAAADQQLALAPTQATEALKLAALLRAGEAIFGRAFRLYPEFTFYSPAAITAATSYTGYLDTAGIHAIDEWIQGLAPVRKRMRNLQQFFIASEALQGHENSNVLSVIQFPLEPVDGSGNIQARWVGMKLPAGYVLPEDNLSLVMAYPAAFNAAATHSGMIIDEWVEEIPVSKAQTGIAVHYNNPNCEAPNACLLAVSPDVNGSWSWDDLMDTLDETLHWAKKRAVEPDLLNNTIYAQVLPGIMAALCGTDDTPALDFGKNTISNSTSGMTNLVNVADYKELQRSWRE
jgi:hypothetical protein